MGIPVGRKAREKGAGRKSGKREDYSYLSPPTSPHLSFPKSRRQPPSPRARDGLDRALTCRRHLVNEVNWQDGRGATREGPAWCSRIPNTPPPRPRVGRGPHGGIPLREPHPPPPSPPARVPGPEEAPRQHPRGDPPPRPSTAGPRPPAAAAASGEKLVSGLKVATARSPKFAPGPPRPRPLGAPVTR